MYDMDALVSDDVALSAENWLFHQKALQEYILVCCQFPGGGLIDKPGRYAVTIFV